MRYEGAYAAIRSPCLGDRTGFAWVDSPAFNDIDTKSHEKLKKEGR